MAGFEAWAIVELMGHARIAGKVTEETVFGTAMMRVDVPKTQTCEAFTKYYSAGSIYCITPTDEATAQLAAEKFEEPPVQAWILQASPLLAAKVGYRSLPDFYPDDYGDDEADNSDEDDDEYSDADDRPIPGLPDTQNDLRPGEKPSLLSDKERAVRRAKELTECKFVIFDTETTGFGEADEIIQIAVMDETGATVLKTLIKPTKPIANSIYHGITDEMVKDAPTFPELYPQIKKALNGQIWLAYNLDYDERMLDQDCKRHGLEELGASRRECVMLLYADFYGEWDEYHGNNRWQKLKAAMLNLGLTWEGSEHDAEVDCKATLAVLKAMAAGML